MDWYILDSENRLVKVASMLEWAAWAAARGDWHVKYTDLGDAHVSTIFVGMNHRLFGAGPPLVFETMVLSDDDALRGQWRYSSWDDAITGHDTAVQLTKHLLKVTVDARICDRAHSAEACVDSQTLIGCKDGKD